MNLTTLMENFSTYIAGGVAVSTLVMLLAKVVTSVSSRFIRVTRADTGDSVTLTKPSVLQSKNQRSAEVRKLLKLMDANQANG